MIDLSAYQINELNNKYAEMVWTANERRRQNGITERNDYSLNELAIIRASFIYEDRYYTEIEELIMKEFDFDKSLTRICKK